MMGEQKRKENYFSTLKGRRTFSTLLFLIVFGYILFRMVRTGSMILISGDAADIWKTIKTYYTDDVYGSYVLYKGLLSIYPYVWLYKLAQLLHTNEFFFCMCYHSLLFAYVSVIAIPSFVKVLTGHTAKCWQRLLLVVALIWSWDRYCVLSELMVDLPSCALFFAAIQCITKVSVVEGWKKYPSIVVAGLLIGSCASISGQYSLSAVCLTIYFILILWKTVRLMRPDMMSRFIRFVAILCMFSIAVAVPYLLNVAFTRSFVDRLREEGAWIPSGSTWMERALVYMLNKSRSLYGYTLEDDRGLAILMDYYGPEAKEEIWEAAANGIFGWTIPEYFNVFFRYPVDFIMLYINRFMVILSDDGGRFSLGILLISYTVEYLALLTMCKYMKTYRNLFCANTMLVLAVLASLIPCLVMSIEMRNGISFYGLVYGVALAGPILPDSILSVQESIKGIGKSVSDKGKPVSWPIIGWVFFCLFGLAYFGLLGAASELQTGILYHLF